LKAHSYIRAEQRRFRRASEGKAWTVKQLPQYYYHKTFCDMLTHVGTRHTNLMSVEHTDFIRDFEALPFQAQCAYARIAGRKGTVFNFYHLHYSEIQDIQGQFKLLGQRGFVRPIERRDTRSYLSTLTKPELTHLMLDRVCETEFKRSWKKARLIDIACHQIDYHQLDIPDGYIVQSRLKAFNYLLFLYFGRIETSLQTKTLKELGLVRPARSDAAKLKFCDLKDSQTAYFYASALQSFRDGNEDEIYTLIETVDNWPEVVDGPVSIKRGKLLQKLGGVSERQGDIEAALSLYERSDSGLCNERVVRIRYSRNADGDRDWVEQRLEQMIENPESDEEHAFAEDFYARKFEKKRISVVTDLLRDSDTLFLDEAFRHTPEQAALRHFKEQGIEAYRTENRPWQMLFGLLFWDEIHSQTEERSWRLPDSLKTGSFYETHKASIEKKLADLSNVSANLVKLLKTLTRHYKKENGVFIWGGRSLDRIKALMTHSPEASLATILRLMAQDYVSTKSGFPDLMLIEHGEARFVEIKAEGDVLRRNQLTRLRQLKSAGYNAEILRLGWHIDPDQTYVVVDVETTGGRPGLHRLTEIGAVKMRGGEVIDEWQSLINPQRSIPSNITRITGIDESMVAQAPLFADIADSFAEFMGDAIFAAHNVNFDYGFISTEYQMIDRKFRHPKICTCSSMRKLYPGYRSYSLKNLCQEFEIDLKSHHRALCDAQAAAELLKMVNEKRIALQNGD
jgi:DNA polymerase-3 subunit epsilon